MKNQALAVAVTWHRRCTMGRVVHTLLLIALITLGTSATGCATDPADGTPLTWSVFFEYAEPASMPCEWPVNGLYVDVVKDADGHYSPDASQREHDEIAIWQQMDPEHHAIDLEIRVTDREGDVKHAWLLTVNWSDWNTEQLAFSGSAVQMQHSLTSGTERCSTLYGVDGHVL
jgi:hypothetical protein